MQMKRQTFFTVSLSLVLILGFFFALPQPAHAACANTTTFDPNSKITLFDTIGPLTSANIAPPILPSTNPPLNWYASDECTSIPVDTTVTFLPMTGYPFTTYPHAAVRQGYLLSALHPAEGVSYTHVDNYDENLAGHYWDFSCDGFECFSSFDFLGNLLTMPGDLDNGRIS